MLITYTRAPHTTLSLIHILVRCLRSWTSFSDCSKASLICSLASRSKYLLIPSRIQSISVSVVGMLWRKRRMFTERIRHTDLVRSFFMSDCPGGTSNFTEWTHYIGRNSIKKNEQKNFESLKMKEAYTKRVKAAVYLYSYMDLSLIHIWSLWSFVRYWSGFRHIPFIILRIFRWSVSGREKHAWHRFFYLCFYILS